MSDVNRFIFPYKFDEDDEAHACVEIGCEFVVPFDDEPRCYKHSPDTGSNVPGYSYKATHPTS